MTNKIYYRPRNITEIIVDEKIYIQYISFNCIIKKYYYFNKFYGKVFDCKNFDMSSVKYQTLQQTP